MIHHAGAIFLGRWTPVSAIMSPGPIMFCRPSRGPRGFLPGLGVTDFMKRTTMVECDTDALARIGPATVTLAEAEGLEAHGLSISRRLNR